MARGRAAAPVSDSALDWVAGKQRTLEGRVANLAARLSFLEDHVLPQRTELEDTLLEAAPVSMGCVSMGPAFAAASPVSSRSAELDALLLFADSLVPDMGDLPTVPEFPILGGDFNQAQVDTYRDSEADTIMGMSHIVTKGCVQCSTTPSSPSSASTRAQASSPRSSAVLGAPAVSLGDLGNKVQHLIAQLCGQYSRLLAGTARAPRQACILAQLLGAPLCGQTASEMVSAAERRLMRA